MYATFDEFKKLAENESLNSNEKVGFSDCYRKDTEINIFPDILEKLSINGEHKTIMDIGCGCSNPVLMLIDFARKNNHTLYLVDSKEMLNNLPNEDFIHKIHCEFPLCEDLQELKNSINYIIVYSVLHHIVMHSNYINFIDSIVELLSSNGKVLIADLPNSTKKKRFLSSDAGIKFHQEWSNNSSIPKVLWNQLEKNLIDDSLILSILQRYRNMGCETYLLEQKDGLPMNKTREDILIKGINMSYIDGLFNLEGKVVIVTGACGQLGARICEAFMKVGCKAVGTDVNIENNKLAGVEYFVLDITKKGDKDKLYESIIQKYGTIDILINNAGVSTFENFEERPEEAFDWVMNVNLKGTFFGIQSYVNLFDKYKLSKGSIINIGSIFGVVSPDFRNYTDLPRKNSEVYGATKAGVIQMTKYFAVHLAERNIRVNCVSPGGIFNPKNPQGEGFKKNYAFRTPMKRMANDEEMVGAILYLASDAASYTTGQNIVIDGGLSAW